MQVNKILKKRRFGYTWVDEMIIFKRVLEKKDSECGSDPSDEDWAGCYSTNKHVILRGIPQSV